VSESVQGGVKSESVNSGNAKGKVISETQTAKKKSKSGKNQIQKQWVSKTSKNLCSQSESDQKVNSGEPILGWVPKKN
jgi:hypothetical protein